VAGAFKVDSAIEAGDVVALIQASDGAADGAAKRVQALRVKLGPEANAIVRVDLFRSGQLDLALGRANVIHAALKHGAASSAFLARADRLRRYRGGEADPANRTERGDVTAENAGTFNGPINLAEKPSG
jgi:uncharacterized protein